MTTARLMYVCPFAANVVGTYDILEFDEETRTHVRQRVDMRCAVCGNETTVYCYSGRPREKVSKFALLHLHRDPLASGNPGSR